MYDEKSLHIAVVHQHLFVQVLLKANVLYHSSWKRSANVYTLLVVSKDIQSSEVVPAETTVYVTLECNVVECCFLAAICLTKLSARSANPSFQRYQPIHFQIVSGFLQLFCWTTSHGVHSKNMLDKNLYNKLGSVSLASS